ncbi:PAAR domain-containing protein [Halomonas sp. HNIBRBA4712]|uniref:PAAR domain-containing protein n=1 Tax=Halomonas sp. HNIBRBA4712 TaxID=3373087 RepID=UPI0037472AFC
MSGKPAARVTDDTACPKTGHGTNPLAEGSPDVFHDGLNAARLGDTSACGSPIDSAVSSSVFINGKPAAVLGSVGSHGNTVVEGSGTVFIGDIAYGSASPANLLSNTEAAYSGRFQLINQDTGEPIAGRRVKIRSSGGWSAFETTDDEGMTSWIKHDKAETIYIDLVKGSER